MYPIDNEWLNNDERTKAGLSNKFIPSRLISMYIYAFMNSLQLRYRLFMLI